MKGGERRENLCRGGKEEKISGGNSRRGGFIKLLTTFELAVSQFNGS
jgi:hypothetical protein